MVAINSVECVDRKWRSWRRRRRAIYVKFAVGHVKFAVEHIKFAVEHVKFAVGHVIELIEEHAVQHAGAAANRVIVESLTGRPVER